jgi:hypothetical protein
MFICPSVVGWLLTLWSSVLLLQAATNAFDTGSWEAYGDHWRYFFDCMLAPVAIQAKSALDKLPATATPRASMGTPSDLLTSLLTSWSAMVGDITRGSKGTAAASWQPQRPQLFAYALAPQHGPVVRTSLSRLVKEYMKWTEDQVSGSGSHAGAAADCTVVQGSSCCGLRCMFTDTLGHFSHDCGHCKAALGTQLVLPDSS